jgi:hypothetical protein
MTKDRYVGLYLERHLKGCKLDYGMEYLNLRDELIEKAEKLWLDYETERIRVFNGIY